MPASGLNGRLTRQLHLREFPRKKRQSRTRGFTLLELLIVIAIISLIVSLIIPAVQAPRESARRTECQNNLRQFGIALLNHEAARKSFPPGLRVWAKGPIINLPESKWAFHGFMPELLPYLEQQKVAELYDGRKMFAAPENAAAVSTVLPVAICPSAPHANLVHEDEFSPGALIHPAISLMEINHGSGLDMVRAVVHHLDDTYSGTSRMAVYDYAGVGIISTQFARAAGVTESEMKPFGLDGMFPYPGHDAEMLLAFQRTLFTDKESVLEHRTKLNEVVDGLSNTVMLVENAARPEFWERGRLSASSESLPAGWANPRTLLLYDNLPDRPVNGSNQEGMYSFHGDVAYVLFVDGHIESLSASGTDAKVVVEMLTPNWNSRKPLE